MALPAKYVVLLFCFLNGIVVVFSFSTSVSCIMSKSSYDFHLIRTLYKIKKCKRIKKYFLYTPRPNSYKLIVFCQNFLWRENKGFETVKRYIQIIYNLVHKLLGKLWKSVLFRFSTSNVKLVLETIWSAWR